VAPGKIVLPEGDCAPQNFLCKDELEKARRVEQVEFLIEKEIGTPSPSLTVQPLFFLGDIDIHLL
jgi:hypothetical protein